MKEATGSDHDLRSEQGSKFSTPELEGDRVDTFYKGVTGLLGQEPNPDFEKGMEIEHLDMLDSKIKFTTANYGLTTDPTTEFNLARNGGKDQNVHEAAGDSSRVRTRARGPQIDGKVQDDQRVLRPMAAYGTWDDSKGLLTTEERADSDTDLQQMVKKAGLRRAEIWALVLYTGPMFTV